MSKFSRITVRPEQMGGVPCVRGLRIPLATVVGMVGEGMTSEVILSHYPDLTEADIQECLQFDPLQYEPSRFPYPGA